MKMTSLKPYLIRAIYDWIVDNHMTPYVLVNAETKEAVVPSQFVQEGKIVLNLRPEAIQGMCLGDDRIEFDARFSGAPMHVVFPVAAVLAVYAKESGKGMVFDEEENSGDDVPPSPDMGKAKPKPKPQKPVLKMVE
jgi:stringent starvation protein B